MSKNSWWGRFLAWMWGRTIDLESRTGSGYPNDSGFTPNGNLVLVLPHDVQETSPGGIAIPETVRQKEGRATKIGIVVAMGDEARLHPRMKAIYEGDAILFARYAGDELPVAGKSYLIMYDNAVMGPMTKMPTYHMGAAISTVAAFGVDGVSAQ